MFQMPGGRRQSRFAVVGGYSGDSCGGGVGVFANQKQRARSFVRRGEKDFAQLVANQFHGGCLSFEMGKLHRCWVDVGWTLGGRWVDVGWALDVCYMLHVIDVVVLLLPN
jgi:hypothetical protein